MVAVAVPGGFRVQSESADHDWMMLAACRESDVDFHPDNARDVNTAIAVCETCPVREDCLIFAFEHNEDHGVWGGTSERGRRRLRRVWRDRRG